MSDDNADVARDDSRPRVHLTEAMLRDLRLTAAFAVNPNNVDTHEKRLCASLGLEISPCTWRPEQELVRPVMPLPAGCPVRLINRLVPSSAFSREDEIDLGEYDRLRAVRVAYSVQLLLKWAAEQAACGAVVLED